MHVVISFLPVNPDGPVPPDPSDQRRPPPRTLWHYTTAWKLDRILEAGVIRPATAGIAAGEQPVVWFSSRPTWEPTASKSPAAGRLGEIFTAAAQGGLVRIAVSPETAPYGFSHLPLVARTPPSVCIRLCVSGLEMGADPDDWRFTTEAVPRHAWVGIERYRFEDDLWVAAEHAASPGSSPVG